MDVVERALRLFRENRYVTLATCGDGEAWASPVNYVIGPGPALHYYSATAARHSLNIAASGRLSGAIFNSTESSDDVDGMQFEAQCTVVAEENLEAVSEYYFRVNFPDPATRASWYRPASDFSGDGLCRFYRIDPTEIYVIDTEALDKVDRRIAVPLAPVLAGLSKFAEAANKSIP